MARNETLTLEAGVWTQATNANAAAARIHNYGECGTVLMQGTLGAVAPASTSVTLR